MAFVAELGMSAPVPSLSTKTIEERRPARLPAAAVNCYYEGDIVVVACGIALLPTAAVFVVADVGAFVYFEDVTEMVRVPPPTVFAGVTDV